MNTIQIDGKAVPFDDALEYAQRQIEYWAELREHLLNLINERAAAEGIDPEGLTQEQVEILEQAAEIKADRTRAARAIKELLKDESRPTIPKRPERVDAPAEGGGADRGAPDEPVGGAPAGVGNRPA